MPRPAINTEVNRGKSAERDGVPVSWHEDVSSAPADPVGGDPEEIGVYPLDEHNATLLDNVAPKAWRNPRPASGEDTEEMYYDLVAIGAGAGGLVSAKQSGRRGAKSALIERHMAGGDCLNVGCVPSKGLIRCARTAQEIRRAAEFGQVPKMAGKTHATDFAFVMARMREARARIAPADSLKGSANVGAACFFGSAKFTSPSTLSVALNNGGTRRIRFGKAVVATGGSALVPSIPGLADTPFHTNASLYNLSALPKTMVVIGAGPIGLEMAQAFALFGTKVTCVLRSDKVLPKEDPDAALIVREAMEADGVKFVTGITYDGVSVVQNDAKWSAANPCHTDQFPIIEVAVSGGTKQHKLQYKLQCEVLLVATGRKPNVSGLGLDAANVAFDLKSGVEVNDLLQTTNPNIYAVGDVCSKHQFTHVAGTHAQMAVQNALFGGEVKVSDMVIPWATFTEPEVAHVGVYAHEAEAKGTKLDTYTANFQHNDRAILEGATNGFVRVHCLPGTETLVGATIVAPCAGEMISELTLAIQFGIPLGNTGLGKVIHSYPTLADGVGGVAFQCKMKAWEKVEQVEDTEELRIVHPQNKLLVQRPNQTTYVVEKKDAGWLSFLAGLTLGGALVFVLRPKA